MMEKKIRQFTISADDFGASTRANQNILHLAMSGKIDRVAVLIRGQFTADEISALQKTPAKIDLHLDIPCMHKNYAIHHSTPRRIMYFLRALINGDISSHKIALIWHDQLQQFEKVFGTKPNGINSHEHTHFFPPYFHIMCHLAQNNNISFIRYGSHGITPKSKMTSIILSLLHMYNKRIYAAFSSMTTTAQLTSLDWILSKKDPLSLIPHNTELICHPERPEEYAFLSKIY